MKLYFNPQSRAVIAKWMLDECGADYQHRPDRPRDGRAQARRRTCKINPAGKLPALVDGEARIFENVAICLYLADRFPEAQPRAEDRRSRERGRYLALTVYSTSQLDPAMVRHDARRRRPSGSAAGPTSRRARPWSSASSAPGPTCSASWFTAADVMIGSIVHLAAHDGQHRRAGPSIDAYVDRLLARPKAIRLG